MADGLARVDWTGFELSPVREADVDRLNAWQNDPEIRDLIMGFRGPVQLRTTQDWVAALQDQTLQSRALFAIRVGGVIQGIVQLHAIDWLHRTALLGVYVGDTATRGAGLGLGATALILDYGFNGLDLTRIGLEVLSENVGARRLYEALGFRHEGTKRSAYNLAGARRDVDLFAMLASDERAPLPSAARRLVFALPTPKPGPSRPAIVDPA